MAILRLTRPTPRPVEEAPPSAPGHKAYIIEASSVSKTYDSGATRVAALRDVCFRVPAGEMVAIMGPSGCGKTTLLNCLSGLDTVDSGEILIEGKDIATLSDRDKTRYRAQRMGFVFQTYNLLPVLTAAENVELPLMVSGVDPAQARERALEVLALVDLADRADHWPAQMSGGQRQRVTIARALVNNPAIVWADEPTGNLDSQMASEVMDLMERLNDEWGQTFVIVTHDPGVGRRCDRIVRMRDGQIVDEEFPQ